MLTKAELQRGLKALHTTIGYAIDELALLDLPPDDIDHGNYDVDEQAIGEAWSRIEAMRKLWHLKYREQEFRKTRDAENVA